MNAQKKSGHPTRPGNRSNTPRHLRMSQKRRLIIHRSVRIFKRKCRRIACFTGALLILASYLTIAAVAIPKSGAPEPEPIVTIAPTTTTTTTTETTAATTTATTTAAETTTAATTTKATTRATTKATTRATTTAAKNKDGMTYIGRCYVTGYAVTCKHCCGKTDGITKSGVKAKVGRTIAMSYDYPFGTRVYIDGLGEYVVEDRGGDVKGNKIDVGCNNHAECYALTGYYDAWIIN